MKCLAVLIPAQAGREVVIQGKGEVLTMVVDGLVTGRLIRVIQISESQESVRDVLFLPKFHLAGGSEIKGILAPEQSDVILVAGLKVTQSLTAGVEKLQGVTDAGGVDDESEKRSFLAPCEFGDIPEGCILPSFEIANEQGPRGRSRRCARAGRSGFAGHLDGRKAAVVTEGERDHILEFRGLSIDQGAEMDGGARSCRFLRFFGFFLLLRAFSDGHG